MGGIDDEVQEHLIEFADIANNRGQLGEFSMNLGEIFMLIGGDEECGADGMVQIGGTLFVRIRMSKLLHCLDDVRDSLHAIGGSFERLGNFSAQKVQVAFCHQ